MKLKKIIFIFHFCTFQFQTQQIYISNGYLCSVWIHSKRLLNKCLKNKCLTICNQMQQIIKYKMRGGEARRTHSDHVASIPQFTHKRQRNRETIERKTTIQEKKVSPIQ